MSRLSLFIALVALITVANAEIETGIDNPYTPRICRVSFCFCNDNLLKPFWTGVYCTVPYDKKLSVSQDDLPIRTLELIINGTGRVIFDEGGLTGTINLRRIIIDDAKAVVFREHASVNLVSNHLFLKLQNCGEIRFEEGTFVEIRGPLTVNIKDCDAVYIEGVAFSWVLRMEISNVRELTIGPGSFALDHTASNIGEHGPGMMIELTNTTINEIPRAAFASSAAHLYMKSVDINTIRTGAFSANTYNVVIAINCSIYMIEEEAFSENSLINYMNLEGCKIQQLKSQALRSALSVINITNTSFDNVESGAINSTVATVIILDSEFHDFMGNGFQFSSLNKLQMEGNTFDELPPYAIITPDATIHELIFINNELETLHEDSLAFIGEAAETHEIEYFSNYYGISCNCNINEWLVKSLGAKNAKYANFLNESFCTVEELIARCFNVVDQNMLAQKFAIEVCVDDIHIKCEPYKSITNGTLTKIQNPRFPHKGGPEKSLSDRNKKVIGIVIVTCFGCILIAMIISLIRWLKRKGYCFSIKNLFMSSNTPCGRWCARLFNCGHSLGVDNARSISRLSINEYSERHCLNDYHGQDRIGEPPLSETMLRGVTIVPSAPIPTIEKCTQTLPEELTRELIDNLKERLENPENYVEAREMIEHLYEISKMDNLKSSNNNSSATVDNIYEIPFQETVARIGKNNERMVSVGTQVPSLEKLLPSSPYYRQPALAHEYFEPKDLAVHLYAEIANDKEKKTLLGAMPDVIGEQPVPRGPYLQKVLNNPSPPSGSKISPNLNEKRNMSLKSTSSNSSGKMMNRPLPKKPVVDPGEGTSTKHG